VIALRDSLVRGLRRVAVALLVAAPAATLGAPARAQPEPAADSPAESFWAVPLGSAEPPRVLTPAEQAKVDYERALRNAEEARLSQELGRFYSPVDGLRDARIRCTPLCGVTRLRLGVGTPTTVGALARALRGASPLFVGTTPERGLGAPPRGAKGPVTWFPRAVHRRFRCDCEVGVVDAVAIVVFERLDGAEGLPDDVKYTRGEARDSALRQLVVSDPRLHGEPSEPVVVVSAGDRARLVHRFILRLDGRPSTVDVDDATLEVVRVRRVDAEVPSLRALDWEWVR
jgi:hypothetical protein